MTTDQEIWKEIEGYSSYEISTHGNIRNIKNRNKLLKPAKRRSYLCITIYNNNGKRCTNTVHRLVALTFLDNPENKATVNHKDHNPSNNKLSNLEWATVTEQNRHKRKCKKEIQELVSSRAVWRIDKDTGEKLVLYKSIVIATKWLIDNNLSNQKSTNRSHIGSVVSGKRTIAYGYKWEYDTSNEDIYEDEIWKDIPSEIVNGTEGYKISNYGRVRNNKGRITDGSNHHSGYLWVSIYPKQYLLHRLVAIVFIPNPENKPVVNHIDGNKSNAHVSNLEWNTRQENCQHACDTGLNKNIKSIVQYDLKMNKIKDFKGHIDAAGSLNINPGSILNCCKGRTKTAGGFIFSYNNIEDYKKKNLIKIFKKPIIQYDLKMNIIKEFNSQKEASEELNIDASSISRCCKGEKKTAGGFIFKFKE